MSTELHTLISAYGTQLTDDQTPITEAEVLALVESIRELPLAEPLERSRPRPWIALAAAAVTIVVVGLIAVFASQTEPDAPPATEAPAVTTTEAPAVTTTEAATTTIQLEEATPTTTSTTTAAADPVGPSLLLEWQEQPFDGLGSIHEIDGVYIAFESAAVGVRAAEAAGEELGNVDSYYWWSVDGESWTRDLLPAAQPGPNMWYLWEDNGRLRVIAHGMDSEDGSVEYEPVVDIEAADGRVLRLLEPAGAAGVVATPVMAIPELEGQGLSPVGWAPFGSNVNGIPAEAVVGGVTLIDGQVGFELPEHVAALLPKYNEGEGYDGGEGDVRRATFDYRMDGNPTHRVTWTLEGGMISAEVILLTSAEPEIIHTGWVELPESLISSASSTMFQEGFGLHGLWLSDDGGATYAMAPPGPWVGRSEFSPERLLISRGDRFLYFVGTGLDVEVWSSEDGRSWVLETEAAGMFEVGSIVSYGDLLMTTSEFRVLRSSDGIEWTDVDSRGGRNLMSTEHGFVLFGTGDITISTDGETWLTIPRPAEARGEAGLRSVGDLLMLQVFEGQTGVWIARIP